MDTTCNEFPIPKTDVGTDIDQKRRCHFRPHNISISFFAYSILFAKKYVPIAFKFQGSNFAWAFKHYKSH